MPEIRHPFLRQICARQESPAYAVPSKHFGCCLSIYESARKIQVPKQVEGISDRLFSNNHYGIGSFTRQGLFCFIVAFETNLAFHGDKSEAFE